MKALVKAKSEPGLWLQDVPEPTIGINDVLIRVERPAARAAMRIAAESMDVRSRLGDIDGFLEAAERGLSVA